MDAYHQHAFRTRMTSIALNARATQTLIDDCVTQAKSVAGKSTDPQVVISPYRFNPLGAHIDHQGGQVLARCLNQYTILCFWPSGSGQCSVYANLECGEWQSTEFWPSELQDEYDWDSMARASFTALADFAQTDQGIDAVVFGTMVSCGLSSSASVILAYLSALADVNNIELTPQDLVELSRRVENDYRGLNNGVQDQMSIVFGQEKSLSLLDVEAVSASHIADPTDMDRFRFLMCYSGVSRNLTGSSFNIRVAECRAAAQSLYVEADHLGQVPLTLRSSERINALPDLLARRARHVYGEMARVALGATAWMDGDITRFGQLMNQSCQSSIHNYESGSEWLIALHEIAREIPGVYGNRFSGGGYGGCLFMLVDKNRVEDIAVQLLDSYTGLYPELEGIAKVLLAESESTVRLV
ncbi:MAG: galactokinase [Flavobacteriaceae bacterium]|jgi:galactokinase